MSVSVFGRIFDNVPVASSHWHIEWSVLVSENERHCLSLHFSNFNKLMLYSSVFICSDEPISKVESLWDVKLQFQLKC